MFVGDPLLRCWCCRATQQTLPRMWHLCCNRDLDLEQPSRCDIDKTVHAADAVLVSPCQLACGAAQVKTAREAADPSNYPHSIGDCVPGAEAFFPTCRHSKGRLRPRWLLQDHCSRPLPRRRHRLLTAGGWWPRRSPPLGHRQPQHCRAFCRQQFRRCSFQSQARSRHNNHSPPRSRFPRHRHSRLQCRRRRRNSQLPPRHAHSSSSHGQRCRRRHLNRLPTAAQTSSCSRRL